MDRTSALRALRRMLTSPSHPSDSDSSASSPDTEQSALLVRFYRSANPSPDPYGRRLARILAWPDERLEACHDYIQVLFPLPEGSPFNMAAPLVDARVLAAFRAHAELRANLRRALERMLRFYGFRFGVIAARPAATAGTLAVGTGATDSSSATDAAREEAAAAASTPGNEDGAATATGAADTINATSSTGEDEPPCKVVKHENWRAGFAHWVRRFDHNHLRITRILRSCRVLGLEREASAFHAALKEVYERYGRISETTMGFWARAMERPLYLAPDEDDGAPGVGWLRRLEEGEKKRKREAENGGAEEDVGEREKQVEIDRDEAIEGSTAQTVLEEDKDSNEADAIPEEIKSTTCDEDVGSVQETLADKTVHQKPTNAPTILTSGNATPLNEDKLDHTSATLEPPSGPPPPPDPILASETRNTGATDGEVIPSKAVNLAEIETVGQTSDPFTMNDKKKEKENSEVQ